MTALKDIKIYLADSDPDLCFYWKRMFGNDAVTVMKDPVSLLSETGADGICFTGSAVRALGDHSGTEFSRIYGNRAADALNSVIKTDHNGILSPGSCISTAEKLDLQGKTRTVHVMYAPQDIFGSEDLVHATDILMNTFRALTLAKKLGLRSIILPGFGVNHSDPRDSVHGRIIASEMKDACELILESEEFGTDWADHAGRKKRPYMADWFDSATRPHRFEEILKARGRKNLMEQLDKEQEELELFLNEKGVKPYEQ